ncbi:hypothetical protein C922_00082 [Plasmodium inui San Antonio 1]|uniref:Uncharacterized protein n=1 Tax=Plasmodium inui San Antonio 1 TaxID=1237626 RepID=W7AK57_9APIC|nr:hypothetical protein C922_00082 [Plasmodium inui San Antonio 1]EUD69219.1 hypothetical protein C922_00082 [Plasmodium inui San Antonio 1]
MENKISFFREYDNVKEKVELVRRCLDQDDDNEVIKNLTPILENLNYLNNCLNSYREAKTVLDPHLTLLVEPFLDFLKRSFTRLARILSYFKKQSGEANGGRDEISSRVASGERPLSNDVGGRQEGEKQMGRSRNGQEKTRMESNGEIENGRASHAEREQNGQSNKILDDTKAKEEETHLKMYTVIEEVYKYYNTLISVRGEKKIKTLFPCDSFCLSNIVDLLLKLKEEELVFKKLTNFKSNTMDDGNNAWVILYILLIWLSFCMYIPFNLLSVSRNILINIEEIFYYYVGKNDKAKEACSILYAQFLRRDDVHKEKIYFTNFILFSKELMIKLVEIDSLAEKKTQLQDDFFVVTSANIGSPNCCVKFSNLVLCGILLTHKRLLKSGEKRLLKNYTNFYNFFFIQNHARLDFTQMSKALKILCLGYYALLFLEKPAGMALPRGEEANNGEVTNNKEAANNGEGANNEAANNEASSQGGPPPSPLHSDLFEKFPLFLNINEVFTMYQKETKVGWSPQPKREEQVIPTNAQKKYTCEKDILQILNLLLYYFNDSSTYIRWCLSKSFGNILSHLSMQNVRLIITKFNELAKYKEYNISCTINYTLFHYLFGKTTLCTEIINFLLRKIVESLYTNKDKIFASTFVLLYSLLKYNKFIQMRYEQNEKGIRFFSFHLIFTKLIVLSLFEDNINLRKSAMSLLQIFIGKFNFFYQFDGHSVGDTLAGSSPHNREIFFNDMVHFVSLFFIGDVVSAYYEGLQKGQLGGAAQEYGGVTQGDNGVGGAESSAAKEGGFSEAQTHLDTRKLLEESKKDIFNANIDILSTCNFSELINLKKSIIIKTKDVCKFILYKYPVIFHLYSFKLFHENVNIRLLAAESLANLSAHNGDYFIKVVLPFLVKKSYEENVCIKHGSVICISKILLKLKQHIDEKLQNEIKEIIIFNEKRRIYKLKKGEILRHSICLLIQSICQCDYFLVKENTHSFFLDVLQNNLFHYNEIIQYEASKIFFYMPIYLLGRNKAIHYLYNNVLLKIVKEKDNFLHLKGYFILLLFVSEEILPDVASDLIKLFYYVLKKCSSYYRIKNTLLKKDYQMSSSPAPSMDEPNVKNDNNPIRNDPFFFKKINFELYPIDFNMKIFCLLALFNVVDKLRRRYISQFLILYEECTTSFRGIVRSKKGRGAEKSARLNSCESSTGRTSPSNITISSEDSDGESWAQDSLYSGACAHGYSGEEGDGGGTTAGKEWPSFGDNSTIESDREVDSTKLKPRCDTKVEVNGIAPQKKREKPRNTSFYVKEKVKLVKKNITWEQVIEEGKKQNKDVFPLSLNINKVAKVLILYLQEYVYESDIGDSHVFVREICLGLTAFLLTSYPLYFFKRSGKIVQRRSKGRSRARQTEPEATSKVLVEPQQRGVKNELTPAVGTNGENHTQEEPTPDYFYQRFDSDDSGEDESSNGEDGSSHGDDGSSNGEGQVVLMYVLFEVKKKYINILTQLLLKLLCEKNIRTNKMCLFLLNYLYNYATFDSFGKMETFEFSNVLNKYCHDFPYELYLKKKMDENIRKSKRNIYHYLRTSCTNIHDVFDNVTVHLCDYYEPIYLKTHGGAAPSVRYTNHSNEKRLRIPPGGTTNNPCTCTYEEEITTLFLNRPYKYGLLKTVFNKINNFIYLYNYALKYTSFSVFHKNKFASTRKGRMRGQACSDDTRDYNPVGGAAPIGNTFTHGNAPRGDLQFENILINNDFLDDINLSESEEKVSIEEENLIKDVHFLLDKTKKNISVIKCLEYSETYLYSHIFYLLFLNKYNYYLISGFFNTLYYYTSHTEYSNYAYTNVMKMGREKSIEFLFFDFLVRYKDVYTFGYIRDDVLFLYIRYYRKFYMGCNYAEVGEIIRVLNEGRAGRRSHNGGGYDTCINKNDDVDTDKHKDDDARGDPAEGTAPSSAREPPLALHLHNINLGEILSLEKREDQFDFLKNIFHNYNIFFDRNVIFLTDEECGGGGDMKCMLKGEKKKKKEKKRQGNKQIKQKYQDKIELLEYVNICLIKILYYLNNFNLIQLETFLKSVNSFVKFSLMNNFAAFCFLNFFLSTFEKYGTFALVRTISELTINIFMCGTLHLNVKRLAFFLVLHMLLHRYPKIREFTNEYLYANVNFISPDEGSG